MRSRQKIITATFRLIEEGGFDAVSVAAVAETAQVSRQTVYSIFGTREDLVSQTMIDVAMVWLEEIRTRMAVHTEATGYIIELIVAGRALCRAHPVLAGLWVAGPGNPLFDEGMMQRAVPVALELLNGLEARDPRYAPVREEVAELVVRMVLSVVLFDSDRVSTDDDLRHRLRRWLVPALEGFVAS